LREHGFEQESLASIAQATCEFADEEVVAKATPTLR
jgi:hypothetical protein